MFYDSVRITGLKISTAVNIGLIKLSKDANNQELKADLIRVLICLCWNSMLLKQTDPHLIANIHHLAYSVANFTDVIDGNGLRSDFNYATEYINGLKEQVYPGPPVNIAGFSMENQFKVEMGQDL